MTNPTDNQKRKDMIQNGFDTVAAGYDHPSLSFFPETARRLIEHLQLNTSDKLLDVCTGTGVVALTAAEKLSQGKVTGIDLSSGMLKQATKKAIEKGFINTTAMDGGSAGNAGAIASATAAKDDVKDSQVSRETGKSGAIGGSAGNAGAAKRCASATVAKDDVKDSQVSCETGKSAATDRATCSVEFLQMDLEHLAFPPGSFDVATSSFGLFFLEDMTKALNTIANCATAMDGGSAGNAGAIASSKVAITSFAGEAFEPMSDIFIKRYEATGRVVPPLSWKRLATEELINEQFNAVGEKS